MSHPDKKCASLLMLMLLTVLLNPYSSKTKKNTNKLPRKKDCFSIIFDAFEVCCLVPIYQKLENAHD